MEYRNRITGDVIKVESEIIGGPWEAIEPPNTEKSESCTGATKKRVKKDG